SPPRPPSPPSGPPRGTNFSRLKVAAPAPPLPERTRMVTSSRNIEVQLSRAGRLGRGRRLSLGRRSLGGGFGRHGRDVHTPPLLAEGFVLHLPRDQREQGVVATHPDV